MDGLIDARIRKYCKDIERHKDDPYQDSTCRCPACNIDRAILSELEYMKMAHRNLSAREKPR